MNIFICSCIENNYFDIRVNFGRVLSWNFDRRYIKVFFNNNLYIFCPEIANFCYKVNRWYFFGKTCDFGSRDSIFCCFSNLKFGIKSICSLCTAPLVKKLFPYLSQI